jgi:hypothetical protein
MLNPLYILMDLLVMSQQVIIYQLETKTKSRFADMCVSCAKNDVDLTVVRSQAKKTFMWWNPGYKD